VVVECDNFKTLLPERYTEKFSEEHIKDINQQLTIGKLVYLVSRGAVENNKFRISGRMKRKEKLNAVYKHKLS
jgi:hypothetical protein